MQILDQGHLLQYEKLALLAGVEIRTVRNAISAGDLIAVEHQFYKDVHIDNASARRWLVGRRGFRPTFTADGSQPSNLDGVDTPGEFAALLQSQRKRQDAGELPAPDAINHPALTPQSFSRLELGIFELPLDTVFPIADRYCLERRKFLACVMRVFFRDEMDALW